MLNFFYIMDFNVVMPAVHVGWSFYPCVPLKVTPCLYPCVSDLMGTLATSCAVMAATALTYNLRHSSGLPSSFSLNVLKGGRTLSM